LLTKRLSDRVTEITLDIEAAVSSGKITREQAEMWYQSIKKNGRTWSAIDPEHRG